MVNFRDLIKDMRERRDEYRIPDSSRIGGYGAFTLDARKNILRELLRTDKAVYEIYKQRLIKSEELWAIQELWKFDGDREKSVQKIYQKVYKHTKSVTKKPLEVIHKRKEEELYLLDLCEEYEVGYDLLSRLLFIEKDLTKMRRRTGLYQRFDREISSAVEAQ
jgi:DNA sulfur modification protein DndC